MLGEEKSKAGRWSMRVQPEEIVAQNIQQQNNKYTFILKQFLWAQEVWYSIAKDTKSTQSQKKAILQQFVYVKRSLVSLL